MKESQYCLDFHRSRKKNKDFNSSNNKLWWK